MVSFIQKGGLKTRPKLKRLQEVQTEIYRQLQLLIPDEVAFHDHLKSEVAGSPVLRMEILERHAYTTFFRLTYEFKTEEQPSYAPDAHIRFYHDARMAEATSFNCDQACSRDTHIAFPERPMMQKTWRKNRVLERWLDYLLKQGHSMESMRPARHAITAGRPTKSHVSVIS